MSRLTLNSNIASTGVLRNLSLTTGQLEQSFTRLSSGMRINRASDDAAGLSVASLLHVNKVALNQGIRNLNDGVSFLNIAEGALGEMNSILIRIKEVAQQSANGTLTTAQRKPLQDEVSALQQEYNRILRSTTFNGLQLLTGGSGLSLKGGGADSEALNIQIGRDALYDAFGFDAANEPLRISSDSTGAAANGTSTLPSISADGKLLVFTSTASNLIPGISGMQVYMKNMVSGELSLISAAEDGTAGAGLSAGAQISADGKFVTFHSDSANLIPGVSGTQVYIKNLETSEIRLVSSSADGTVGSGSDASVSADGRYVTFNSSSNLLIPGISSGQVYRKDMHTGEIRLVSEAFSGGGAGNSLTAKISGDGNLITFRSSSSLLIDGVTGSHIYLKNMTTGEISVASSNADGEPANTGSTVGVISMNGRYVAFQSAADNILPGVAGGQNHLYLKDLQTGGITLLSATADGTISNANSTGPSISADGRYVVFRSNGSNLNDGVSGWQIYRKDTHTGELLLLSTNSAGEAGSGTSREPIISANGLHVVWDSEATNLVEGDSNGMRDVFYRDLSRAGVQELAGMLTDTQTSALITLDLTGEYLEELSLAMATAGAASSRLEYSLSNMRSMSESLSAATSQITDADIAEESARLTANRILQQSSVAVLDQANQQPELVLTLLSGL